MVVNSILSEKIKAQVEAFVVKFGGDYSNYYIGITNDVKERIKWHIDVGWYTQGNPLEYWDCATREKAVSTERHFQMKGMEKYNPNSWGVEDSQFLYCYKLTPEQRQDIEKSKKWNEF